VLLHRLEQRGLRLGRGAVDLVGEDRVREHRPRRELEQPSAGGRVLLEDLGAGDVARHEVGGELHPREGQVERLRDRLHEQRLREPGTPTRSACPPARSAATRLSTTLVCPMIRRPIWSASA
jgi:hypothetical protein